MVKIKNIYFPGFAEKILAKTLNAEEKRNLLGDYREIYLDIAEERGLTAALYWYWWQIIKCLFSFFRDATHRSLDMFKNYLKIALRNLRRHKSYTFINISGLAVGIACCLLILLYIWHEVTYDTFYQKSDSIYRIAMERTYPNRVRLWSTTANPLAKGLVDEFPEVTDALRLWKNPRGSVRYGDKSFAESRIFFSDPNFFEIFDIPLIKGDPKTVLVNPGSVVITEAMAEKYFGDEDPLGKTILMVDTDRNQSYIVTGVSENVPQNAHFHYDFMGTFANLDFSNNPSWNNGWVAWTYLTLQPNYDPDRLEAKLPDFIFRTLGNEIAGTRAAFETYLSAGNGYRYFLQPIRDIHLHSKLEREIEANSDIFYVYLLAVIAFFILFIACINFINLSTARSANRAKEVGVRKVIGSYRKQLINQFLTESMLLSFLSMTIALLLFELLLPYFNQLLGNELSLSYKDNLIFIPALAGFGLVLGIIAGSYPAFFLSAFKPVSVLKGKLRSAGKQGLLRNVLVVMQFSISIFLVAGTFIVYNQVQYVLNQNLGFAKEQILVIKNANALRSSEHNTVKQELTAHTKIHSAAGSNTAPGRNFTSSALVKEGGLENDIVSLSEFYTDWDIVDTYGLEIVRGRGFSTEFASDSLGLIINESAAKAFGLSNPIGTRLRVWTGTTTPHIIGVMKDFHYESLHSEIRPMFISLDRRGYQLLNIRLSTDNVASTVAYIEDIWEKYTGGEPFSYSFLDEEFDALYRSEQRSGKVFGVFSVIAILIACLGLFGLASFTTEQKTKEIGVRKVLGATVPNILKLLSKEFIQLVVIALALAVPITYYIMNNWLNNFAYRMSISPTVFLFAGIGTLLIALLTVSYQSIKAALTNPVTALKNE